jgi:cysteine desulfurase/selenocysteine lyase
MSDLSSSGTPPPHPILEKSASDELRSQMPVVDKLAYFDHAAVAPLTAPAAAAMAEYARAAATEGDLPWPKWASAVERLRKVAAEFLGADQDEIALVNNTTQGIGFVAEGFPWRAGDNVVVPDNEFPSNSVPWATLARRGVELRRVPIAPSGVLELSQLARAIDGRTRIVSISWVGFISGYRIDVGEVAELVHSRGALFMLDAIQGLGAFKIDVHDCGIDFLAADGHKWMLGPEGAGLFYLRREHLELLQPLGLGWNSLAGGSFDPNSQQLKATAARYEGGSTNMAGMLAFHESLNLLHQLQLGPAVDSPIAGAVLSGTEQLAERLQQQDFRVHFPADARRRSGILGISWPSSAGTSSDVPESVALAARKHCIAAGVVLSVRGGRLRASTHAYNNVDDIERLVDALVHFRKTFSG